MGSCGASDKLKLVSCRVVGICGLMDRLPLDGSSQSFVSCDNFSGASSPRHVRKQCDGRSCFLVFFSSIDLFIKGYRGKELMLSHCSVY